MAEWRVFSPLRDIKASSCTLALRNKTAVITGIGVRKRALGVALAWAMGAGLAQADTPPAQVCAEAGHQAEQQAALPQNLLLSIGVVESGRADPLTGHVAPWPWTVNADGQGQYFSTKEAAMEFVRLAQSSGAHDIDVGCFQVSLEAHPDAFATLDEAFDPSHNASYAAGFLTQLKGHTGSWGTAIADYHSAMPELGLPYQRRVLAAWKAMGNLPFALGAYASEAIAYVAPDPVVIMQSAAAKRVHVYSMNDSARQSWHPGLPRVIEGP